MAKNSKQYWEDRERLNTEKYVLDEEEYQQKISQIYERTLRDVQARIDEFYRKYADSEGITIAEARKRASKLDIERYSKRAAQ